MRLAIIAAVVAILMGFGAGYLMWGERSRQAIEERQRVTTELDAMRERQADEFRRLKDELAAERGRRQRLEEVISQGRK
jgi:hypothetical protein